MTTEANHPVRTTEKSLHLIEKLRELDGARIHELEDELEMTKGAIHNHLSTLRTHGYVVKEDNEYRLSLKVLTLGGYVRSNYSIYQFGRPKANKLASDTGMLVNLATEENGQSVYLYQARGEYAVNLDTQVGHRLRLHNIAIGKAILAYLPAERVEAIVDQWGLPKETENTITDRETLFEELESVREQEFATDLEERTEGLCCIAAPIRPDNEILGAISISAPTSRLGNQGFDDELVGQVKSTANEIALDIKYV
ncbi:IclR family transcriptional regulator [Natrarchaeobius oligotrophus]|uniref:IclR family transcriptional regulator n=1 Tax=Natrarchaeobius chitinivorans TaxID=1679083 RepID=A0A3N6N1J3_NATCH|nr:IclR family transcriptional regulator [Natrarchaeobius chitinivorans]RQH02692.1 IclR family transcriptional regulator [Natrarchaeobius chitinivorans]